MVSSTASTRQPPAGGPKATLRLDDLLRGLRRGERDAFVRYFRLFRAPVHQFALLMLHDGSAAADATSDALVRTFRHAVLDGAAGDPDGTAAVLEVMTYGSALEACEERLAQTAASDSPPAAPASQATAADAEGEPAQSETALGRRFAAALEAVEPRRRAALLLHDLAGLDEARRAAVLGLTEAAAAALLFRAREEFRDALRLHDGGGAEAACRQAEDAAAGAVGLGMGAGELSRLQRHAEYCAPCSSVMKEWTGAGAGLAAVLDAPPLPAALSLAPVFGEADAIPAAGIALGASRAPRVFARAARMARGRAAAWIVAVACVAAAVGFVMHESGLRPLVVMQSVGPAIRLIAPPADGSEAAEARPAERHVTGPVLGLSSARRAVKASAPAAGSSAPEPASSPRPEATAGGAPDGQQASGGAAGSGAARETTVAQTHGHRAAAKAKGKIPKARGKVGGAHGGDGSGAAHAKVYAKADKRAAKADKKAAKAAEKAASSAAGGKAARTHTGKTHGAKHAGGGSKAKGKAAPDGKKNH